MDSRPSALLMLESYFPMSVAASAVDGAQEIRKEGSLQPNPCFADPQVPDLCVDQVFTMSPWMSKHPQKWLERPCLPAADVILEKAVLFAFFQMHSGISWPDRKGLRKAGGLEKLFLLGSPFAKSFKAWGFSDSKVFHWSSMCDKDSSGFSLLGFLSQKTSSLKLGRRGPGFDQVSWEEEEFTSKSWGPVFFLIGCAGRKCLNAKMLERCVPSLTKRIFCQQAHLVEEAADFGSLPEAPMRYGFLSGRSRKLRCAIHECSQLPPSRVKASVPDSVSSVEFQEKPRYSGELFLKELVWVLPIRWFLDR